MNGETHLLFRRPAHPPCPVLYPVFFRPTHRITISKYLARGLRVRRSGVLPLCLGPNSVAERIIPPSEILGRQSACPTRFIHCLFQCNLRYLLLPDLFYLPALWVLEPLQNHPGEYLARGNRGKEVRGLAPSASGQILSLSGVFAASVLTQCLRCCFGFCVSSLSVYKRLQAT